MIDYVLPHNPDTRVLRKASDLLKDSKLIALPSDTNWVVLCDIHSKEGVQNLYRFKKEDKLKHFSIFCHSLSMASDYALIEDQTFRWLKKLVPGHYTFILEATKLTTKLLKASKSDQQIGIRFPPVHLIQQLIEFHGGPLASTQLPSDEDHEGEVYSYQIEENFSHELSQIIDPGEIEFKGESTIIDFTTGVPEVIRQGSGPNPF
jgi:tRNA threonylcarbamoyl adenosine modification protein (Sua5/YciO/YrdC/YwlC family)